MNAAIADLQVGLCDARKTWGFVRCFLHLRIALERLKRVKPKALAEPDAPDMTID